jgi:phage terminase large subunit-like protein
MTAHTIDAALSDRRLLGAALGDSASWSTWIAVLRAAFGLPLDEQQRQTFADVAGCRPAPVHRVRELWAIVGRRAGKSRIAAAIAVYLACFVKHKLSAGEQGMVLTLAASTDQARVVFGYARAFLEQSLVLRQEIVDATRLEIRLRSGVTIAMHANSFRTTRGRTLCAAIFDECAVWRDEASATPDVETYRSVLPSLLTTRGMLVGISTGYRRVGLLYQKHRDHFGEDSADTLVVQGSTLQFNATVDEAEIASQAAADPIAARSEWFGEFPPDHRPFAVFLADVRSICAST